MGFYFRKSFGVGPLRLNLSRGGLGVSAGVRGARVGVDARGRAYVHCGRGGIYYRSFIGHGSESTDRAPPTSTTHTSSEQREIESGDLAAMSPATASNLLNELQRRRGLFPHHLLVGFLLSAASAVAFGLQAPLVGLPLAGAALIGTVLLFHWVRRRRQFRLEYELDGDFSRRYEIVLATFRLLCQADRIWLVQSEGDVYNRKYHAGATKIIGRSRVLPSNALPRYVESNLTPPMIPVGRQTLYLLPDRILVYQGNQIGAVDYADLSLHLTRTRFIEDGEPPSDARQVDSTWKYVNKGGGPDRRFGDNRQLPVMEYAELRWTSASGLHELLQVSNPQAAAEFADAVRGLASRADRVAPQLGGNVRFVTASGEFDGKSQFYEPPSA